jgi:hypothetical protein
MLDQKIEYWRCRLVAGRERVAKTRGWLVWEFAAIKLCALTDTLEFIQSHGDKNYLVSWYYRYRLLYYLAVTVVQFTLEYTVCRWKGHELEVEGDMGPDHGYEYVSCKRCDWSKTIKYY